MAWNILLMLSIAGIMTYYCAVFLENNYTTDSYLFYGAPPQGTMTLAAYGSYFLLLN